MAWKLTCTKCGVLLAVAAEPLAWDESWDLLDHHYLAAHREYAVAIERAKPAATRDRKDPLDKTRPPG